MENSTPLPDWSLSLEMQFYFIFPLLLIATRKIPLIIIAITLAATAAVSPKLFGNYLDAGLLSHFGQPSFLPYRLNAFFAGMLVALWLKNNAGSKKKSKTSHVLIGCAAVICVLPLSKPLILLYLLFVALCYKKIPLISKLLSLKPMRFLGNISYSIYLCHILIVYPVLYVLIQRSSFLELASYERFLISLSISTPMVIISSYVFYKAIELPFIALGKRLSNY
jgi:peptidoglycan/LPS O-acetylase OafA/YrhL